MLVLDSVGIGGAPDASEYGDAGACTLGHIAEACRRGEADEGRAGLLKLPNLSALGLRRACEAAWGQPLALDGPADHTRGRWGHAIETSRGKDSPSGHWELAGLPIESDWGYFRDTENSFPPELLRALCDRADLPGTLGNCHGAGTEVLERHGDQCRREGKPICYTSVDSVFQIAAHEETFGLERLLSVCEIARELLDDYRVCRVIARPFVGGDGVPFSRTNNRRDFAVLPHRPILPDHVRDAGGWVQSVGKIRDIYAGQGIDAHHKASGLAGTLARTMAALETAAQNEGPQLIMSNLVDFDTDYGHRRDVAGYARELEAFDARLPQLCDCIDEGDLLVITADHGCDPTWPGTDHTREQVPVLCWSPSLRPGSLGRRESFADVGQTLARWLGVAPLEHGTSFL